MLSSRQTVQTIIKCRITWHFIGVFTVYQSNDNGFPVLKKFNVQPLCAYVFCLFFCAFFFALSLISLFNNFGCASFGLLHFHLATAYSEFKVTLSVFCSFTNVKKYFRLHILLHFTRL